MQMHKFQEISYTDSTRNIYASKQKHVAKVKLATGLHRRLTNHKTRATNARHWPQPKFTLRCPIKGGKTEATGDSKGPLSA